MRSKAKKDLKRDAYRTRRDLVHHAGCVLCTHDFIPEDFVDLKTPVNVPRSLRAKLGFTVGGKS